MRGQELQNAAKQLFKSLVNDVTSTVQGALSQLAAKALSSMLSIPIAQGGGIGSLLSGGLSKLFGTATQATGETAMTTAATGLTTATTGLTTAVTGLTTATTTLAGSSAASGVGAAGTGVAAAGVSAGSSAVGDTAVVSAITTMSIVLDAAILSSSSGIIAAISVSTGAIVSAVIGGAAGEDAFLAALNVKPSVLGFSYSGGGIVPSAAGGMVVSGGKTSSGGQLSVLHEQEMVLPKHISNGIQNMIRNNNSNNSGNMTLNSTANFNSRSRQGTGMSRSEFSQAMAAHGSSMMGEARNMYRQGWRPA